MNRNLRLMLVTALLLVACGSPAATEGPAGTATPRIVVATLTPTGGAVATGGSPIAPSTNHTQAPKPPTPASTQPPLPPTKVVPPTKAAPNTPAPTPTQGDLTTQQIYEKLRPATVRILATVPESAVDDEGLFSGTGFVYDLKNGYIITNAHVIEGASVVQVALDNSDELRPAKIIGRAQCDDLAVLQVLNTRGLTQATLGNSDTIAPGARVAVLGYPRSFDVGGIKLSVTAGEVSVTNQKLDIYQDLIRHTAPTNPGNSGGPLVNPRGEVVGINSAGVTDAQGLNFAISMSYARRIIAVLEKGQNLDYLGLNLLENEDGDRFGVEGGLVVAAVASGGPGFRAGVKPADVIVEVEGQPVDDQVTLCDSLRTRNIGEPVRVTVFRGSTEQTLEGEVAVGRAPTDAPKLAVVDGPDTDATPVATATTVAEATPTQGGSGETEVVISEDFESGPGKFLEKTDDKDYSARVANGAYKVSLVPKDNYGVRLPDAPDIADGGVFATVKLSGGGQAGLTARWSVTPSEKWHMYVCWISNEGTFGCDKYVAQEERKQIIEEKESSAIKPGEENELSLIVIGETFTFSVNDEEVAKFNDTSLKKGAWGLFVRTLEGNLKAQFDNAIVIKANT